MNGYLLVNKPKSWTSFDVVAKIRNIAKQASGDKKFKVGHAGTLDPMATGLLIVLLGTATKQQDGFMKLDKTYQAEITFGSSSSTYDAEGELSVIDQSHIYSLEEVGGAVSKFVGKLEQIPPAHSAIKVDGQRAYKLAREGKKVKLKARNVEIYSSKILDFDWPRLCLETEVSSGTYIRSLANDLGNDLKVGGYLSGLKRSAIGQFSLDDAFEVEDISPENIDSLLKPINQS
ncbi:tRNA pseudouridine(55) synthase TruB [Candidatus Saccharibacteria bacterium]|jgi:tRNA pseudouridine55 synthase|nr:tRNA pseudouridine(55) synthase TruB [Candidatus Saccharibacteria bacterium]MBP9132182.1 tRNA pseudouridine(55) synthase TruB [Candidatus Saccharibacteria bacterium]